MGGIRMREIRRGLKIVYDESVNKAKQDAKHDSHLESILESILNHPPADAIWDILDFINTQLESLRKVNDLGYGMSKSQILDELVKKEKLDQESADIIKDAINFLKQATQTKDIGPISAKIGITVGLKSIDSLKAIYHENR